jgi:hypothetical protein
VAIGREDARDRAQQQDVVVDNQDFHRLGPTAAAMMEPPQE